MEIGGEYYNGGSRTAVGPDSAHAQCDLTVLQLNFINETTQNLEKIKVKLSWKYHDLLDVFDRAQTDKLSSHRFYDHQIKLLLDVATPTDRYSNNNNNNPLL